MRIPKAMVVEHPDEFVGAVVMAKRLSAEKARK